MQVAETLLRQLIHVKQLIDVRQVIEVRQLIDRGETADRCCRLHLAHTTLTSCLVHVAETSDACCVDEGCVLLTPRACLHLLLTPRG